MYSRATSLIQFLCRWSEHTRCVRPFRSSCGTSLLVTERTFFLISNHAAASVVHYGLRRRCCWQLLSSGARPFSPRSRLDILCICLESSFFPLTNRDTLL